jgi:hypothetical protein
MNSELQMQSYLNELRVHLAPMTLNDREEIVREISAHIRDTAEQTGAGMETILERLGSPSELAAQYRDGLLIRTASRSISPVKLMRGALRLATKGFFGVFVSFVGMIGYAIGGGLTLSGMLKPIFPSFTGMWMRDGRLIAFGTQFPGFSPRPPAHEVLGMWYIPLMLTAGSLTILLTTYLIRSALRISQKWQLKLQRNTTWQASA